MPEEIQNALEKVVESIKKDKSLLSPEFIIYAGKNDSRRYTVENFENLAVNHLFDDFPHLFNITQREGYGIRWYFMDCALKNNYSFVQELHQLFPDFFVEESPEYLLSVNSYRRKNGLSEIVF